MLTTVTELKHLITPGLDVYDLIFGAIPIISWPKPSGFYNPKTPLRPL